MLFYRLLVSFGSAASCLVRGLVSQRGGRTIPGSRY